MIRLSMGKINQIYAAISCSLGAMMSASAIYWISPILDLLTSSHSPIPMSLEQSSWLMTSVVIGEVISALPTGYLLDRFGRKFVILSTFPMVFSSWLIIYFGNTFVAFILARTLHGMALSVIFGSVPVYVAEISEPKIRGLLSGVFQIMWNLGILWAFSIGPFLSYNKYLIWTASISIIFLVMYAPLPESPYYLLMKGREKEARRSLKFFRSGNTEDEFNSIKQSFSEIVSVPVRQKWYELFRSSEDRKMLLVVISVSFVRYMGGAAVIPQYLSTTVEYAGKYDKLNPVYVPIILAVINLIAAIFSSTVVDILGRKPLIFISTIGSIVLNAIAGVYYLMIDLKIDGARDYSWIAYVSIASYFVVNTIGLSSLMQTLQGECFSSHNRATAGSIALFLCCAYIFISFKQYQPLVGLFGMSLNFFSYSFYSLIGSFMIFAFMKETAGKSLCEIQEGNKKESPEVSSDVMQSTSTLKMK